MSFDTYERDPQRGRPVELYRFVYGDNAASKYHYTNAEQDIRFQGVDFVAIPIDRAEYQATGKPDQENMEISVPLSVDLANLFLSYPPTQPVAVTVWQGHIGDPDNEFLVAWVGLAQSAAREGNEAVITCTSSIVSLKRPALRRNYQYACPHALFGEQCGASMSAASHDVTVVAIDGDNITLSGAWYGSYEPEDFVGGMISWSSEIGTEYRMIVGISDGSIRFTGPVRGIEVGDTLTIIRGCNHLMDGCRKHNNINNYGGMPWIPLSNPVIQHPYW